MKQWLSDNMALMFATVLIVGGGVLWLTSRNSSDVMEYAGILVVGLLYFLLWLAQRGES